MARTTILLPDDLLREVKRVAETRGVTMTEVIRNALRAHIESQPAPALPSFTGTATAPRGKHPRKTAQQVENVARKAVDPYEGSNREGRR